MIVGKYGLNSVQGVVIGWEILLCQDIDGKGGNLWITNNIWIGWKFFIVAYYRNMGRMEIYYDGEIWAQEGDKGKKIARKQEGKQNSCPKAHGASTYQHS